MGYRGRALPGVTIGTAAVGGMDAAGLRRAVAGLSEPELSRPVVVRGAGLEFVVTARELGLEADVEGTAGEALSVGRRGGPGARLLARMALLRRPVAVRVRYLHRSEAAAASVARIAGVVAVEARDARVEVAEGRLVVVGPSQDGVAVDEAASLVRVVEAIEQRLPEVVLAVELRRPDFTTEAADGMAEPVAQFTTRFGANPDRIHNIRLAAAALRGALIPPGSTLSFNKRVGPRDAARGYLKAPVLIDNDLVPGDGGGVCQVSSTLFNAAVLAGMATESRTNHSRPVPYLPAGRDAAVEYGLIDLVLRNTTGSHLFLWTEVGRRTITVTLYGPRQEGRKVRVTAVDPVVPPPPPGTVTKRDPLMPEGETVGEPPKSGLRVRTLRIVEGVGGDPSIETVAVSTYQPVARTRRIGAGAPRGVVPASGQRR